MTYVPIVTPPPTGQPPSPRTRELAELLAKVLDEYRKAHPSVTGAEIREAFRLARMTAGGSNASIAVLLSLGLGLLVAGGTAFLLVMRGGGQGIDWSQAPVFLIMAVVFFLVMILAIVKHNSR